MAKFIAKHRERTTRYTLNLALKDCGNKELESFFNYAKDNGVERSLIEFAARVCYNSTARLGTAPNFIRNVLDGGHLSVSEHPSVGFHLGDLFKIGSEDGNSTGNPAVTSPQNIRSRFQKLTAYNRFFVRKNNYAIANIRSWIELLQSAGTTVQGFEEILTIIPDAFDTTPALAQHTSEFNAFVNFINVPIYGDESGLKVALLAANVDFQELSNRSGFVGKNSEYGRFTWLIEGVSRSLTHQLVRHRLASVSQESQRYVDAMKHPTFVYPPGLTEMQRGELETFNLHSLEIYRKLRDSGMKKEDARFVLPNGIATRLVFSLDLDALVHFLNLRCAKDAQWEIRRLAFVMGTQANLALPNKRVQGILEWTES